MNNDWATILKVERRDKVEFYKDHKVLQIVEVIWQTNPNLTDGKKYPPSSTFSSDRNSARDETYSVDDPNSPIKIKSIRQVGSKKILSAGEHPDEPEAKHSFVPIDFLLRKYDNVLIYLSTDKGLNDPRNTSLEMYSVEEHHEHGSNDLIFMFGRGY